MKSDRLQALLLEAIKTEIESRLNQSLHQRVYIADPNPIASLGDIKLKISPNPQENLAKNPKIEAIFDRPLVRGRLFIRGVPGSGKTTLLLQLAKVLVNRAVERPELPLPILLDVSSWPRKQQAIAQWIISILKRKYALDSATAKKLIKLERVILLFDGLDQLKPSQQNKCIEQLNSFLQNHWSGSLAVCGGLATEQNNHISLNINAAIELQLLTPERISAYLLQADCELLWNSIKHKPELIKIARSPLFLNLMILSATEINLQEWQQLANSEDRLTYLWNAYIRSGLKRGHEKIAQINKIKNQPQNENNLNRLSWLAQKSIKQPDYFSQFDYSWLENPVEKIASVSLLALIAGFMSGVIFWLMFDRTFGFSFGAALGLIIGTIAGIFIHHLIPPQPPFSVTKQTLIIAGGGTLLAALICGGIAGSIFWPILGQDSGIIYGTLFAVNGGFIFALVTLFSGGLSSPESRIIYQIQQSDRPEAQWLKNLFPYLIVSTPMGTFWLWIVWILQGKDFQGWQMLIGGIVIGGLLAIAFGGLAAIHQFSIRLILWFNRRIPWNHRQFLNYAKTCLFLQRVRGVREGYRFIHPLLCQQLANYDPS